MPSPLLDPALESVASVALHFALHPAPAPAAPLPRPPALQPLNAAAATGGVREAGDKEKNQVPETCLLQGGPALIECLTVRGRGGKITQCVYIFFFFFVLNIFSLRDLIFFDASS